MKIYCGKDYKEMSRIAANIISAQIILKPTAYWDLPQVQLRGHI